METYAIKNVAIFQTAGGDKNHFLVKSLPEERVATWLEDGWQLGDLYRVGNSDIGGWL